MVSATATVRYIVLVLQTEILVSALISARQRSVMEVIN